jgi:ferredoxin--NADP+ reductase
MTTNQPSAQPLRLAVIGSGPAGVYAAETLLRSPQVKSGELEVQCDLFDALPTPFGLIRYGVAPDHPRIKGIITALHRILDRGDIRFLGDVEFGTDLTAAELRERYDAVIFATGALKDAELNIPGIDLEGSYGAADFVAWYDGNPDYPRTWPLEAEQVAMIGNGNVALDAARMLAKSADELLRTEIPENVYEGLASARTTDVHVFGRRGPAQSKFTPLETRELAHPRGVQMVMDPADFAMITPEEREAIRADRRREQVYATFEGWLHEQQEREAKGEEPTDSHGGPVQRRLHLHFWHKPVEVVGEDGRVTGMRFERTRLDADGNMEGTGELVDYDLQAVYRAIGYFGSELPGVSLRRGPRGHPQLRRPRHRGRRRGHPRPLRQRLDQARARRPQSAPRSPTPPRPSRACSRTSRRAASRRPPTATPTRSCDCSRTRAWSSRPGRAGPPSRSTRSVWAPPSRTARATRARA